MQALRRLKPRDDDVIHAFLANYDEVIIPPASRLICAGCTQDSSHVIAFPPASDQVHQTPTPLDISTGWMSNAACRERAPSQFFPSDGAGAGVAKRMCAACPVRKDCLEYALFFRIEHGIWGGCSERARKRILQRSRAASAAIRVK